jgi:D-alanine-D-alanine ligase
MIKQNAKKFGRVAVVFGGDSAEREVSLVSGNAVLEALKNAGVDTVGVDGIPALLQLIKDQKIDRVFNILHGRGGEDGILQGALEAIKMPYTGSGILGSALAMDKVRTKYVWQQQAIPTPDFRFATSLDGARRALHEMGLPLIVKPVREGSTLGVVRVTAASQLEGAFMEAAKHDSEVLIERLVVGGEYTVGILGKQVLPTIRIVPKGGFYDYQAKYVADDTQYLIPSGLPAEKEALIQSLCLRAFEAVGCTGWGRVDVMVDDDLRPWLLEVNTTPGMTSHSLVPKAAAAAGISFAELCLEILATSEARGG